VDEATFRLTLPAVVNCTYDYPLSGVKFQSLVKLFFGLPRLELKESITAGFAYPRLILSVRLYPSDVGE
jgi:hypothetical protein